MAVFRQLLIAFGIGAALVIVGSLLGNYAKSAEREPAGLLMFQCTNENDIMRAAAATERARIDKLKKLHLSDSCTARRRVPAMPQFLESDAARLHFSTTNAGGGDIAVYEVKTKAGSTWMLFLMNPAYLERA